MKRGEWQGRSVRGWGWVLLAVVVLAVVSATTNLTAHSAQSWEVARLILSRIVHSGTVWAGLLVLAGWLVKRPREAAPAGVLAGWAALAVHYGFGQAIGVYTSEIWAANLDWFAVTAVAGVPLGVLGAAAHRGDDLGVLARLVVPVGALAEPLVRGMFTPSGAMGWPWQTATPVAGGLLAVAGAVGIVLALARGRTDALAAPQPIPGVVSAGNAR